MEKNNEAKIRSRRNRDQNRDQYADFQNRNEEHSGNRPFAGLSPNYESNYRPGEYGPSANRNQDNRNEWGPDRERYYEGYFNGDSDRRNREWSEDENQYGYHSSFGSSSNRDGNRFAVPPYEKGNYDRDLNQSGNWQSSRNDSFGKYADANTRNERYRDENDPHRGKGPKGYTRSDERIKEDVHERLTDDGLVDASEIEVDVRSGEVILKGTVHSRQEKRRTEDIIDRVSGVKNIENRIKVDSQNVSSNASQYTNGLREKKAGLEYGHGAVSGMANTSATGDLNTAR